MGRHGTRCRPVRRNLKYPGQTQASCNVNVDYGSNPVDLIFCNPDLIWRAEFAYPRLGQGGFITAFQAIFEVGNYM